MVIAGLPLHPSKTERHFPSGNLRNKRGLEIGGKRPAECVAPEYYGTKIRLQHQGASKRFHNDHQLDRATPEPAVRFRKRQTEQPEFGKPAPDGTAPSVAFFRVLFCCSKPYSAVMKRSTLSFRRRCSSVNSKSISLSEPQNCFCDNIALYLVRTPVDRDFAPVEVSRRSRGGIIRTNRGLVPTVFAFFTIRQHVGADHVHKQFRCRLLDFGAFDFQDRRSGIRFTLRPVSLCRDNTELGHFEGLQLNFNRDKLLAKAPILDKRNIPDAFRGSKLVDTPDALLRYTDPRNARSFVAEKKFRIVPTLVLLANEVLDRDLDIIKENFVDFPSPVNCLNRAHGDAGAFHINQQK